MTQWEGKEIDERGKLNQSKKRENEGGEKRGVKTGSLVRG